MPHCHRPQVWSLNTACARASSRTICHRIFFVSLFAEFEIGPRPEPHAAAILPGTGNVSRMPTPRATQARDELGLKARLHRTPPDDVGLDAGSSLREGTGLWGWLWGPWRFSPAPRGYVHLYRNIPCFTTFLLSKYIYYPNISFHELLSPVCVSRSIYHLKPQVPAHK